LEWDDMYALSGRVGLVTGAGGGIGREIARRLAREGMAVAVLDRDTAAAQAVAAEIGGLPVVADVTSPEGVGAGVDTVLGRFNHIDVLVNNAGVAWMGPALDMPLEALQTMLRVNVEGVFITCRAVLPHMTSSVRVLSSISPRGPARPVMLSSPATVPANLRSSASPKRWRARWRRTASG
jgi:NAD(P)-dependent dehydrogenase (short-subunit alcohol dehydrogenase family)